MKIYLDTNIVSGRVLSDLAATEMTAVQEIERARKNGLLDVVTSRETHREQDRAKDPNVRSALERDRANVPVVADDHRMLGNRAEFGYGWFTNSPILTEVVDDTLLADLKAAGLKDADARHLMYAVHNGCDRFATLDSDFLNRRPALEKSCRCRTVFDP